MLCFLGVTPSFNSFELGLVPLPQPPGAPTNATPHRPVLIILVAIFFLLGTCFFPFIYLLHSPLFFFGVEMHGKAAGACLALLAALSLVAGVGLLRLRSWGWVTALAYQVLGLVNMACFVFIPGATDRMLQATMQYEVSRGMPEAPPGFPLAMIMRASFFFGMVMGIAVLWILFAYKKTFSRATPAAI